MLPADLRDTPETTVALVRVATVLNLVQAFLKQK
jgi:hypothetical protein